MNVMRRRSAILACLAFLVAGLQSSAQTRLVISQMYGGGGNTGAQFTNDFLELYNPTASAISLNGLSIQYAAATSAAWNSVALPNVSVAAGHYFLIQAAAGTTITNAPLSPAADFVITSNGSTGNQLNFSATAGKVAIVNGVAALAVACPAASAYVDLIGFGATANCFEGTGPAPAPSNTTADLRTNPNADLTNNALDFITGVPAPHNSGSASVPVAAPTLAIHTIQGVKSLSAATVSPYAGQQVTTSGVVTTILSNAFFIQARDVDADANPLTPEGIEVFTSTVPSASVIALGNLVSVTGTVQTFPAPSASHTPATEITSPTVTLVSTGNPLPTPVALTSAQLTPSGGLYQLTPYEGMRVSIASLSATSGTNGSISAANEANELATSTGYFYAVMTGTPRPFRERGIDIRDPLVPGTPAGAARFDDNPERILVNSVLSGGTSIEISTGAVLPNVTGVLDFTFSSDALYDPSRLILDSSYNRASVVPGMTVQPVAPKASNEFTVASFNIERFFNPAQATSDDLYYVPAGVLGYNGSGGTGVLSTGQTFISAAVDVTSTAYANRLTKVSLAIRTVLNSPDVVTLEEVENQSVANDIAAKINSDAGVANLYTAYSTDNSTFYSQDGTGISVGFLAKNTVSKLGLTQFGQGQTFTPTTSTNPITLNDRPWLVLDAGFKRASARDYPVTIIVNHMKALTGENSATSTSTRQKKELQAEAIARYIQTLQVAGRHVISGGDFNAFEFSDGYADTLATYTNTNVLPATQVLQPGVAGLVTPPLTNLALNLPANQRWSYVEDGSAQILDQMVVTADLAAAGAHLAYAHLDADFPATAYNDSTTAARTSDHDAAVGYFILPAPVLAATLTPSSAAAFSGFVGSPSTGQVFTFSNTGEGPVTVASVTATGDYAVSSNCAGSLAINTSCTANVVFTATAPGIRTGTLLFASNVSGSTFSLALTGTALLRDFTVADSAGNPTTSLTLAAGSNGAVSLVLTPINGFTGTLSLACASAAPAKGVGCFVPGSIVLGPAAVPLVINFSTTARASLRAASASGFGWWPHSAAGLAVLSVSCLGLVLLPFRQKGRVRRVGALLAVGAGLLLPLAGCGGTSTSANANGTPAGTYTYTLTASSGGLTHAETITLIVQ